MSEEQNKEQPMEYKLLIDLIFERKRRFFRSVRYLVQNQPFKFGLRIKNIDRQNTPKGKIKAFTLRSGERGSIEQDWDEEFTLAELNPGEEVKLWWPNSSTPIIQGQSWVECVVEPEDKKSTKFITYQFDRNCNKESRYKEENQWGQALFIRGELEHQQARTNNFMFLLTLLVFLDGVLGLDIILKRIFGIFGWLFSQIGLLFTRVGM